MNERVVDRHGQRHGKVKDTRFLQDAVIVDLLAEAVSRKTGMNNKEMADTLGVTGSVFSNVMHGRGGEKRGRKDKGGLSSTAFIVTGLMEMLSQEE